MRAIGSTQPTGWTRSPWALWGAFALVHALVIGFAFLGPGIPLGDVTFIYQEWMRPALSGGYVVGIDGPWVYPFLALVPLALAGIAGIGVYGAMWLAMVVVIDAVAFGFVIGWARSPARRHVAAWWWLGFVLALGPIALTRIDAVSAAIAIVALLFAAGRPRSSAALLTIATWMKVWPAALIAALLIASRRRVAVLVSALVTGAVIALIGVVAGGGGYLFSFVGDQTSRQLQIEAPVSTIWMWLAVTRHASIVYDRGLNTFEVAGPGADAVAAVMTALLAVALLIVAGLGIRSARLGAHFAVLFPPLALAFVTAFIVFNKVGSPQYLCWIAPPLVLGICYRRWRFLVPGVLGLVAAVLTQAIYPFWYGLLLAADPFTVFVLTLRNLVLVALLAWSVTEIWFAAPRKPWLSGSTATVQTAQAGEVQ